MEREPILPVYAAKVTDVIEWSGAGWCTVFLRFDSMVAHFPVEVLYALNDPAWAVGSQVSGTLHVAWGTVERSDPGLGIAHHVSCDFDPFHNGYVEIPIAPASSYELWGKVLRTMEQGFLMDCGMVIEVGPNGDGLPAGIHEGEYVRVLGKVRMKLHRPG